MKAKIILIIPTGEMDTDLYYTAELKAYNTREDVEANNPYFTKYIDSFRIQGDVRADFEFAENGQGIRLWPGNSNEYLDFDNSYGPYISCKES